jgi:hypothetical protein
MRLVTHHRAFNYSQTDTKTAVTLHYYTEKFAFGQEQGLKLSDIGLMRRTSFSLFKRAVCHFERTSDLA